MILYNEAEISELMVLFILSNISKIVHIGSHSIYRDDGLFVVLDNKRNNDSTRTKPYRLFNELIFDITVEMNRNDIQNYMLK